MPAMLERPRPQALLKESISDAEFTPPNIITTQDRRNILAERKEAERLAKEKAERETAEAELHSDDVGVCTRLARAQVRKCTRTS